MPARHDEPANVASPPVSRDAYRYRLVDGPLVTRRASRRRSSWPFVAPVVHPQSRHGDDAAFRESVAAVLQARDEVVAEVRECRSRMVATQVP